MPESNIRACNRWADGISGEFKCDDGITAREHEMFEAGFEFHKVVQLVMNQQSISGTISTLNVGRFQALLDMLELSYDLEPTPDADTWTLKVLFHGEAGETDMYGEIGYDVYPSYESTETEGEWDD